MNIELYRWLTVARYHDSQHRTPYKIETPQKTRWNDYVDTFRKYWPCDARDRGIYQIGSGKSLCPIMELKNDDNDYKTTGTWCLNKQRW